MLSCGEQLIRLLENYGIDTAFGIPGTHTIELYRGLQNSPIKHVTPRHEQGAGFMADGYARVTGKPALCLTVSGPGALNIAGAMGQALQDSVPMLVISADNATEHAGLGQGRLHETNDISAAMAQCSIWSHRVTAASQLPDVIGRAFALFASARPGPVHIAMPLNITTAEGSAIDTKARPLPTLTAPDSRAIDQAVGLLENAKTPLLVLGGGSAACPMLATQLAEKLQAVTTLTHNARGLLPAQHPLLLRASPSMPAARSLYENSDVILAIGTEFSETDYDFFFDGNFKLSSKVVRVDIDHAQLTRNINADIAIQADAGLAMKALLEKLDHVEADTKTAEQRAQNANASAANDKNSDYQTLFDCILETLPDTVLLGDSTQPAYFAADQYFPNHPRRFASAATGYGTLGYALPAAFGAKLGKPELPVIALIGDGGLQFSINELAAGVEAGLSIAILVWNNTRYEMIAQNFESAGMKPMACDIYTPDFIKIAQGYGCQALRVETIDQLTQALSAAQKNACPTLIELREDDFLQQ